MERIYPLLYQYLLSNKILLLPKIGTFSLSTGGGRYDYATREIQAPVLSYNFNGHSNAKKKDFPLYTFISNHLGLSDEVAESEIDLFCETIWEKLQEEKKAVLPGIGTLQYINENVLMESSFDSAKYFPDVDLLPFKRENADTVILSGDKEMTKTQMQSVLETNSKKSKWWVYLLIVLGVLGIAAVLFYFLVYKPAHS